MAQNNTGNTGNGKGKENPLQNAFKLLMPIAVPYAVKQLLALVPPGSKVDDFFAKYKENWGKVSAAVTMLVLQITKMPDLADDLVTELSAEVARVIKEKYSDGENLIDINPEKTGKEFSLSAAMPSLTKNKLVIFTGLLQALPEKQRKKILAMDFGGKELTKEFIKTLVTLDEPQFKAWAEVMSPADKPHVDTEFEKNIKEGLNEFKSDAKSYFQKDSWAVRLAKSKGLM
jgi:hypothetical protein